MKLPPLLEKAEGDNWYYLLATKDGQQWIFGSLTRVSDEWIHLNPVDDVYDIDDIPCCDGPHTKTAYRIRERGIDVRLDAIAWVADGVS